jgi:hypothetical protein
MDGSDNDGDGMADFPDDLGCVSDDDESEDSLPSPACKDGRDNDGDGKRDFPNDPGCFAPQQDDETDDCPSGPGCPQCSDGMDNDMNGQTDYPNDAGGCASASDTDEYTQNPVACGSNVMIKKLPFDGHVMGTLMAGTASSLTSPACGGGGAEEVYELRINAPKVVVASTDNAGTSADTVLYIRSADCQNNSSELTCNDDVSTTPVNATSKVTQAISTPGTYYLVVDAHDSSSAGAYELQVDFFVGEGIECQVQDDCGPGLVCRVPKNGTIKVCSKHVCEDNDDEDNDGKNGYPDDPGCITPTDDDETDGCPGVGPTCPECADGIDNDGDTKTDYGANGDTTCSAASSASEACLSTDGVTALTVAQTMGTTVGATNDVKVSCATTGTHTSPDKTYRLDLPAMADLNIGISSVFSNAVALYDATCTGAALQCESFSTGLAFPTGVAAGTYYLVVDGYSTGSGDFTITVSGHIQNGQSCEAPLAQVAANGAITCGVGYACKGTAGSRTCQPALCSDGVDNDSPADGKIDFPFDPGCTDPADDTEADPGTAPVCADGVNNDGDGQTDFPADFGCVGAGGASEVFCMGEMDPPTLITTKSLTGTTVGKSNDWPATTCQSNSNAPDVAYALQLPVAVQTLVIDTNNSALDTVLQFRNSQCAAQIACDDDGGDPGLQSKITLSSVSPGGYAIIVDAYSTGSNTFNLNVQGTVAPGTPCGDTLFSGGANAVLVCPTGTTCTGTPLRCQ